MPAAVATPARPDVLLAEAEWTAREAEHAARVRRYTDPHQERAARGEKHPVCDFLFSYYAFRPAWLRQWHPGPGVALAGAGARKFLRWPEYGELPADGGDPVIALDPGRFPAHRREFLDWLESFLAATAARPAQFGCHGLHEWAMVYRQSPEAVRHAGWPLRLAPEAIAATVSALPLRCTHFDAFRFFTAEARPLNRHELSRATVAEHEQRGCLHAGMDLYKWAFKLAPFTPGSLLLAGFELAAAIREVDMRASPYDLAALGFPPIAVETPAGRAEYERWQREFAARGEPLRAALLALCRRLRAP